MILQTFIALMAVGLVVFAVGVAYDRPELAFVGALFVLGTGAIVTQGGLMVAEGSNTVHVNSSVAADDISRSDHVQTMDIGGREATPTGVAFDDSGGRMYVSGNEGDAVYWYNTSDWGLSLATFEASFDVSGEDATPQGLAVEGDGEWLFVAGDATDAIYQYNMSDRYNVSTASLHEVFNLSADITSPRSVEFGSGGERMYVVGEDNSRVAMYSLSDPYNVSTATQETLFDTSTLDTAPTGIAFSVVGSRMLLTGASTDSVYQYRLSSDYLLGTASYTGNALDVSGRVNQLAAVEYEDGGRIMVMADRQQGLLLEYDSTVLVETEETRTVYREVDSIGSFPLPVIVVLLGGLMVFWSLGRMSEQ